MTEKFPAGPYIVANVHEADDMDADAHHEDTLGVYVKSDFDNVEECPSALCFMNHNWGGVEDIAKLFAAAPDLLIALQGIINWCDLALANPKEFDSHGVRNLSGPAFDIARDAIAAALSSATSSAAEA